MAKYIKVPEDGIEMARECFEKAIANGRFEDGRVSFTFDIGKVEANAEIEFSKIAWRKMKALVDKCDKEIAWHGICRRGNDDNLFLVDDIIVYPQTVTGATVETDQEEYQNFLAGLDDDTFNNMRFQGHSHVNMATSPSSTDNTLYTHYMKDVDDFYVFMIINKRNDIWTKIYDVKNNIMFESSDIKVTFIEDELESWVDEALKKVKTNTPVHYGGYGGYAGYGGYTPGYEDYGVHTTYKGKGKGSKSKANNFLDQYYKGGRK